VLSVPIIAVTTREDEKKDKDKKKSEDEGPTAQKVSVSTDPINEIVFVVSGDTVGIREVKTGIQDNDYIEIRSGLSEGEQVVSGPYSAIARKLKAGAKVRIEDKDKKKKEKDK
jgi:HlyD family secretion protein